MAGPNFQLGDTEKAPYSLTELDAASQPATPLPSDVLTIVSDSPGSLSIVPDATPKAGTVASGFIVGGTPKVGVVITATVKHADGTSLTTSDTVDVVGGAASSLSFGLGSPVPK